MMENIIIAGIHLMISSSAIAYTFTTLRASKKKALFDADSVEVSNAEKLVKIAIQDITIPVKLEINELRKETKRLRTAIESGKKCQYSKDCPIIDKLKQDNL